MAMTETNSFRFHDAKQRVQQHIQHPYLVKNKIRRSVSQFHHGVLVALLQVAKVEGREADKIVDAALLLQHGLSIHDEVDTYSSLQRQLIVLAGDYSSSHYYSVLAQLGNFELMSKLCAAVVKTNEAKMALYGTDSPVSPERYMELSISIHGQLLFAIMEYYDLDSSFWGANLESLLRAYVVHQEMTGLGELKHFTVRQAHEWVSDAMQRISAPGSTLLEPVAVEFLDSLALVRRTLDHQTVVEENP